jgi:hypothetical protein
MTKYQSAAISFSAISFATIWSPIAAVGFIFLFLFYTLVED